MRKICVSFVFFLIAHSSFAQSNFINNSYKLAFSYLFENENVSTIYFEREVYLQFRRDKIQSYLSFISSFEKDKYYDLYKFKDDFFYGKNEFGSNAPLKDFKLLLAEKDLSEAFKNKIIFCNDINGVLFDFGRNRIEPDFNHITPPAEYKRVFFLLIKPAEPLLIGKKRVILTFFSRVILGFEKNGKLVAIDGWYDTDREVYVFDVKEDLNGKTKIVKIGILKHNTTDN